MTKCHCMQKIYFDKHCIAHYESSKLYTEMHESGIAKINFNQN